MATARPQCSANQESPGFSHGECQATRDAKQEVTVGIDEGARHVGVAIVSQDKVLVKGEIELRQDVHSLLLTRAQYRRSRRFRKTRYRKARFLNRKRPEWWLPPSIRAGMNIPAKSVRGKTKFCIHTEIEGKCHIVR